MAEDFPEIMTIDEKAQFLRTSSSSVNKMAQDDKIPRQKVGQHWQFRKEAINRWPDADSQTTHLKKFEGNEQAGE